MNLSHTKGEHWALCELKINLLYYLLQQQYNKVFFSISKSSKVGGGGCCHEHPMNDSFSLKWNPWEMLPITWFISYLQFSADNIFVYIFTRVINFSVSAQIITLCDSILSRSSGLWERRRKTLSC